MGDEPVQPITVTNTKQKRLIVMIRMDEDLEARILGYATTHGVTRSRAIRELIIKGLT